MARFGFDAFLSYSSDDRLLAGKIVEWLRVSGFKIWYDVEQIPPGEEFRTVLERGLDSSQTLIALLTPAYAVRNWTKRELAVFDAKANRRIIGVQVGTLKDVKLDKVFLVKQRLIWNVDGFDPEAFWLLYCGLKKKKPGPQNEWANEGNRLVAVSSPQLVSPAIAPTTPAPDAESSSAGATDSISTTAQTGAAAKSTSAETHRDERAQPIAIAAPARHQRPKRPRLKDQVPLPASASAWACVGPTNIGGRATSVVCHPARPEIVWLGTAGGGVWKSHDCGRTWRHLWHREASLNVGSLAIDPVQPDTLYCGTGEVNLLGAPGVGVFRTLNGGNTWSLLASVRQHGLPNRIGVIAIDPFDPKHILLGGVELTDGDFGGMHTSRDGGRTWTRESFLSEFSHSCYAIVFHPTRRGVIFAAFTEPGFQSGIWRSMDAGKTWKHLTQGLPSADCFRRTNLAIAPSKPDTIYAMAADFDGDGRVLGVFVSDDIGSHWKSIGGKDFRRENKMMAGNAIAVHPADHRHLICGGRDLYATTDGGQTWRQVTWWDYDRGHPKYAHARHTALAMPVAAPGRIYDANNGGMDFSEDGGRHWMNRSNGLAITPYYKIAVAPSDSRCYGGGTDANGVVITTTGRPDDHFELLGGSAGALVFDPKDPTHLFASHYNLNIYRWRGSRSTNVTPPATRTEMDIWNAVIALDPSSSKTLFTGSYRLWRSRNDGEHWQAMSSSLDGSYISAIEVSGADRDRIYVGTEKGGLFRSLDGAISWSNNIAGAAAPRKLVTSLKSSPVDADVVFVAFAGYGRSHVFRSDNGGVNWIDVDLGMLPDVPHHALAIPDDKPGYVYVCNDIGVFVSPDLGTHWQDLTGNLPNTPMLDLVYHQNDGALYVATFGRSIWRLQIA